MTEKPEKKALKPARAIRAFCDNCMNHQVGLLLECPSQDTCPLWCYRKGWEAEGQPTLNRPRAIQAFCLTCLEGPGEVRNCAHTKCPLHTYRRGKNPLRQEASRQIYENNKAEVAARIEKMKQGLQQWKANNESSQS